MTEIMNDIYYMMLEQIGQESMGDVETKILMRKKSALIDELILRLGPNGEDLIDELAYIDGELDEIRDKALFRAALRLGTEAAHPRRRQWTASTHQYRAHGRQHK